MLIPRTIRLPLIRITTTLIKSRTLTTLNMPPSSPPPSKLSQFKSFTACDVSDALLKLSVPNGGHLPGLTLHATPSPTTPRLLAFPISTVLFARKTPSDTEKATLPAKNFPPKGSHWVDCMMGGTVVVVQQPGGQGNAVVGGIMARRMKYLGVEGVVVDGRIRDLDEQQESGLSVWSKGVSTVGSAGSSVPHAHQVPLTIDGITVKPGDILIGDERNGVAVIPIEHLDEVLRLMPLLTAADNKVQEAVAAGMSVAEAFAKFRNNTN